jgi:hypothetical protein
MYIGSNNTEHASETQEKHGRTRSLPPEQELFMILVRLRCGLLGFDIASRFGISQAQYSRIETTWLGFLYHRLRALPIWASRREHVHKPCHKLSRMPIQIPVSLSTALRYILKCQHRIEVIQQPILHIKTTIQPKGLLEYLLPDTLHLYQSCMLYQVISKSQEIVVF